MPSKSAVMFLAALLAAFCAAPAHAATDACSLLTQSQVNAALGFDTISGEHVVANPAICQWAAPGKKGPHDKKVTLSLYVQMGSHTPVDRFNIAKTPVGTIPKTPVSGIGDEAFYATTPGLGTALIVRKGSQAFDLRVSGFSDEEVKDKEKSLAADVLGKL